MLVTGVWYKRGQGHRERQGVKDREDKEKGERDRQGKRDRQIGDRQTGETGRERQTGGGER